MLTLKFYGGVGEIGGNKILLEDRDTRVFIDFGMSYSCRRRFYFEPYLSPRDERGLLEFGILPDLHGVYRFDESEPSIDGVILSHSHSDHSSCISFINRKIPIYCGETTRTILECLSETRTRTFETDIEGLRINTFRTGSKVEIGGLEVEPIHVDHSVPAAYGFIIHTSEGAVAYTGDLRTHGAKGELTQDFIEKAREAKPEILICEGTNISGADVSSEGEVMRKVGEVVSGTDGLVMATFSYADVDRFKTFYEVSRTSGRKLAISMRQAYILDRLRSNGRLNLPEIDGESLIMFQRSKKRYSSWEEEIQSRLKVKSSEELKNMQDNVVMACSLFDVKELIEIRPKSGSNFIHSASEPVNEEGEIEFTKLLNWLDHFGLPMYQIHCSGHIMPNEIKDMIVRIRPKTVHPIHTEHPELFAKFLSRYVRVEPPKKYSREDIPP
ncbi:MAG: MBL fold metallo-hydrolase [Candidatus Bathyarchaeia archaeon]